MGIAIRKVRIDGELEIDMERGVLYFHSKKTGTTLLRICGLKFSETFGNDETDSIDVTLKLLKAHPVSYQEKGYRL